MFFFKRPVAKFLHDTAYLAVACWNRIHNYLGTSEGSVLNFHRSGGFGIMIQLSSRGRRLLRRGRVDPKKCCQANICCSYWVGSSDFDGYQKAAAIDCLTTPGVAYHHMFIGWYDLHCAVTVSLEQGWPVTRASRVNFRSQIRQEPTLLHKTLAAKKARQVQSGFGGLVVSTLASCIRFRGFESGRSRWIFRVSE